MSYFSNIPRLRGASHTSSKRWSDGFIGLVIALASLGVYMLTLAPSVTTEYSGELITAAATLGVPHPPGFPLWCLLAHGFTWLPINTAVAVNLASAVFGAATVGLVFAVARSLGASNIAASVGALLFGYSQAFWAQAVIAEVYTLNTLILTGMLWGLVRWFNEPDPISLVKAAACFGLALANHYPLTLLTAPAIIVFVVSCNRTLFRRPQTFVVMFAFVAIGGLLYLYLPWAAGRASPMTWNETGHWDVFWNHVLRREYRSLELGAAVTLDDKFAFFGHFLRLWGAQFTPWVLVPGLILGALGMRRHRPLFGLFVGIMLLNSLGLIAILRFEFAYENILRVNEYYLPTYLVTALFIAVGLDQLVRWLGRAAPVLWAAPTLLLASHWAENDRSSDYLAVDYNRLLLESLEPNAVYFASGDHNAFPAVYLQAIENVRPDVLIADYTGRLSPEARAYALMLDPNIDLTNIGQVQAAFVHRGHRPMFVASKSDLRLDSVRAEPWGLTYRILPQDVPPLDGPPDLASQSIVRNPDSKPSVIGLGPAIMTHYFTMRAESHIQKHRRDAARKDYFEAVQWAEEAPKRINNIASTMAERGFYNEAIGLYRRAASLSRTYVSPRRNLALLYDRLGRKDEATVAFRTLLRLTPRDPRVHRRLAELMSSKNRMSYGPEKH